jgi:hypothetical protein
MAINGQLDLNFIRNFSTTAVKTAASSIKSRLMLTNRVTEDQKLER